MKKIILVLLLLLLMNRCNSNEEISNKIIVTTTIITDVTQTTAIGGGYVTNETNSEVIERDLCYSTSPNPTGTDVITSNGSGVGNFISHLTGLKVKTTYYVRAYATNNEYTIYGNEQQFTT